MKRPLVLMLLMIAVSLKAQLTNQGYVVINPGTHVYVSGLNINNALGAHWNNNGIVHFAGSQFNNDGTMSPSATAETHYIASTDQELTGASEHFYGHLYIDQPASANTSVIQKVNTTAEALTVNDNGSAFEYKVSDPSASGLRLTVTDALTLNGNLRLYDDSQLLQTTNTAPAGTGKLYRDQMGTGDKYWYNYWCAPVNNGGTWKVQDLMDGRNPDSPQPITFVYSYTGSGSSQVNSSQNPAYLNEAWIYTMENAPQDDYSAWHYVGSTGTINPAVGYTMKGPDIKNATRPGAGGSNTEFKAYTFAGTPNNGTFSFPVDAQHVYLIGNPYPSALDANAFINDNNGQFNGTLYFWEHVGGSSHYLNDYVGGYALYTLSGGVAAKDWPTHTNTVGTKIPGQYIPVGQGFFVYNDDSNTNGTVTIQNSQRYYYKEDNSNSIFLRNNLTNIRLHFIDPVGGRRHLLLAVRPGTTFGYDWGWDGPRHEGVYHGDMYFRFGNTDYLIQAVPYIHRDTRIPLHVIMNEDGNVSFGLDDIQNVDSSREFYIEDTQTNETHQIELNRDYSVYLQSGDYPDRFYLVFRPSSDLDIKNDLTGQVSTYYALGNIVVKNPSHRTLRAVRLFDLNGKLILEKTGKFNDALLRIPVSVETGVYLVEITGEKGHLNRKILVE